MSDKQLLDTYILAIKNKKTTLLEWKNFCEYVKSFSYFKDLIKSGILD
jgi:hypothetical protein